MARFDEKRSLSEQKGGKSVENGEKRSLLEQKGEIQQKEIEFHRISSKFGQIRLKRQFLGYGRTENYPAQSLSTSFLGPQELPSSELEYLVPRPTRIPPCGDGTVRLGASAVHTTSRLIELHSTLKLHLSFILSRRWQNPNTDFEIRVPPPYRPPQS